MCGSYSYISRMVLNVSYRVRQIVSLIFHELGFCFLFFLLFLFCFFNLDEDINIRHQDLKTYMNQ